MIVLMKTWKTHIGSFPKVWKSKRNEL